MRKHPLWFGSISMALAVLLGAWGAHGAEPYLDKEQMEAFHTGVNYQIYHSLGLLLLGALFRDTWPELVRITSWLFRAGIVLFSGSIYFLSTRNMTGLGDTIAFLGPVTPVGGLCFITGWVLLFIALLKRKEPA